MLSQTSPGFLTVLQYKSFENTEEKVEIVGSTSLLKHCGKGEIAHNNCRSQTLSVWKSVNFVIWERVTIFLSI